MKEWYRVAKIVMTAKIEVLVNDTMSREDQEQRMTDLAIDFVRCLNDSDVTFEYAEFDGGDGDAGT